MSVNTPYREVEARPDPRLFLPSGEYVRLDKIVNYWWVDDEDGPQMKYILDGIEETYMMSNRNGKALEAAMKMWVEGTPP